MKSSVSDSEFQAIARDAIAKGWLKFVPPSRAFSQPENPNRQAWRQSWKEKARAIRKANIEAGLTFEGKERKRANLTGLTNDEKRRRKLEQAREWIRRNRQKV